MREAAVRMGATDVLLIDTAKMQSTGKWRLIKMTISVGFFQLSFLTIFTLIGQKRIF